MADLTEAIIFDDDGQKELARIGLNGYRAKSINPTIQDSPERTIWSFKITSGDAKFLYDAWSSSRIVKLRNGLEKEAKLVRVAAYPADVGGFGLIEFV